MNKNLLTKGFSITNQYDYVCKGEPIPDIKKLLGINMDDRLRNLINMGLVDSQALANKDTTDTENQIIKNIVAKLDEIGLTENDEVIIGQPFVYIEDKIKYAGTVDLMFNDTIVEFLFNKNAHKDISLISAYCHALNKEKVVIFYINEDSNINIETYEKSNLKGSFKIFAKEINKTNNIEIDSLLYQIHDYRESIAKLKKKCLTLEAQVIKSLTNTNKIAYFGKTSSVTRLNDSSWKFTVSKANK